MLRFLQICVLRIFIMREKETRERQRQKQRKRGRERKKNETTDYIISRRAFGFAPQFELKVTEPPRKLSIQNAAGMNVSVGDLSIPTHTRRVVQLERYVFRRSAARSKMR